MAKRFFVIFLTLALVATLCINAAWAADAPKPAQGVTFNFVDVELSIVAKFISETTGKNLIFDERLRGKISIIAPTKLSPDDAYALFVSVLQLKGFVLLPSGVDAYKIVPVSEAKYSGIEFSSPVQGAPGVAMNENFIARVIQLKDISADEAMKFLSPLASRNGHMAAFGPGNLLLVIDSGLNIEKMLTIIDSIDLPMASEEPEVVFLTNASADTVTKILNEGMQRLSQVKSASGNPAAPAKVVSDARLNAVILFGSRSEKDALKKLIALLDVPAKEAQSTINVYFLENADAEDLSKVLSNLIRPGSVAQSTPGSKAPIPGASSPFEFLSGISITPDKATNALVLIASPSDYQSLMQVIKQLDRKRKQVYVEALILEASIDRLQDLGSKWRASATKDGEPVVIGGVGTMDTGSLTSILSGLSGFTVGGMGNYLDVPITRTDGTIDTLSVPGFAALFNASEFKGAVNILSSPQILTSDNTEAEILVGENVPFISARERDATTTNTVLNSIERKDVGITLRITPQITEGDYVKLETYQEISAVKESSIADAEVYTSIGPTTTKRSTKTTIAVRDGQTVVIGGLIQESENETFTMVPLLHRIPLLGWLFKNKTVNKVKTNLLVFITPHIVRDPDSLTEITRNKQEEFARKEQMYPQDEVIIKFRDNVLPQRAMEVIASLNAEVVKELSTQGLYLVRLPKGMEVLEAVRKFERMEDVKYAEPNYRIRSAEPAARSLR